MSKKSWPFLYSKLIYQSGQVFKDIEEIFLSFFTFADCPFLFIWQLFQSYGQFGLFYILQDQISLLKFWRQKNAIYVTTPNLNDLKYQSLFDSEEKSL